MVAYFKVKRNAGEVARLMTVTNVTGVSHANEILKALKARHVASAVLVGLEDYSLVCTAHEVQTEKNLLGGPRRYSTGSGTVTIPESQS